MGDSCYDVIVIGAGVCGCAIARELSRRQLSACVLEAEEDVCCGTSKANSAIVHAGFDAATGTLMARLNVEGSRLMGPLCEELGVDFERIGSIVVCVDEAERGGLDALLARDLLADKNGRLAPTEQGWLLGNELYGALWDLAPGEVASASC